MSCRRGCVCLALCKSFASQCRGCLQHTRVVPNLGEQACERWENQVTKEDCISSLKLFSKACNFLFLCLSLIFSPIMETSSQSGRVTITASADSGANGPAPKVGGVCNKEKTAVVGTMESSQERGVGSSGGDSYGPPSKRHADLAAMEDGDGVGGDPRKNALAGVEAGERGEPGGDGTSRGGEAGGSAKVTGMLCCGRAMRSLCLFFLVFLNGRTKTDRQRGERVRAERDRLYF